MKKLILLDANHLMHRAYWAIQRTLRTSKGEQTNAVFGVASMLLTLLKREHPDQIIACFDEGSETFRHTEHKEYKAGRVETPDDFYQQIPRVKECVGAYGIPMLSDPLYEADDLIGTLALLASTQGYDVLVVSGDKDLFQLADTHIRIAIPHKGYSEPEYLDAKGVEEKLGVRPDQVPDYKGLTGDASDNLRGVKGIGPKTAVSLLKIYGSLEGIYDHTSEIRSSVRRKLEEDKESAFFTRRMAQIVTNVPLALEKIPLRQADALGIDQFFEIVEFYTLRRRFRDFLTEDPFAHSYFAGEPKSTIEEEHKESSEAEEQLPLLD